MVTAEKLSIDRYLAACIQIEEMAAEIYRLWSNSPGKDRSLQAYWRMMEQEELAHARQIEQLRRLTHIVEIGAHTQIDGSVLNMVEYARSCVVRITFCQMPTRVALFLAIRMKERCAHFYETQSLALLDERVGKVFRKLARDDHDQSRQLQQLYEDHCEVETAQAAWHLWPGHCVAG